MNKKILQRFKELEKTIIDIEATKYLDEEYQEFELLKKEIYIPWKVQVLDLFIKLITEESTYYKEFIKIHNSMGGDVYFKNFQEIKSIFIAFKHDYEKGYLNSIKTLVQAEVFENQLEQSEELLKSGYILASAVIAGVVLETGIREICA